MCALVYQQRKVIERNLLNQSVKVWSKSTYTPCISLLKVHGDFSYYFLNKNYFDF